jgi:glutaredoxin
MIEIWGKTNCSYCSAAKALCEQRGFAHTYKELDKDFNREEILEQFPAAKTFPQIRINGTPIGGFDNLKTYLEETGYNGTGHSL